MVNADRMEASFQALLAQNREADPPPPEPRFFADFQRGGTYWVWERRPNGKLSLVCEAMNEGYANQIVHALLMEGIPWDYR